MKTIVVFKINKNLDFQNHLIGLKFHKHRHKLNLALVKYYKKLEKAGKAGRFNVFKKETARFYDVDRKKFRNLILKSTQNAWNLVEKEYIRKMEKIHNKQFPYKRIYGILSTAGRYGYNYGNKKWFACSCGSPLHSVDIAAHEIMHLIFHKYFFDKWKKKFSLGNEQMWAIKESVTVILNSECDNIMFKPNSGYPKHKKLRKKIENDWRKYKDFERVLSNVCVYVKANKMFLK